MSKKTAEPGKTLIKQFEGFRATAYLCPANVWTVGYGTTRISGKPVRSGMKVTTDEAENLLDEDLKRFEDAVNSLVQVEITQNQFDALVSFVYNVGVGSLQKSTLLKKLNAGLFSEAAEQFLRWDKAKGKRLAGLTRRRKAERELFLRQ